MYDAGAAAGGPRRACTVEEYVCFHRARAHLRGAALLIRPPRRVYLRGSRLYQPPPSRPYDSTYAVDGS